MNRRSFFETLLGGVAAASTLDIEKLLWTPTKTIFIPPPVAYVWHTVLTPLPEVYWRSINEGVLPIPSRVRIERITLEEYRMLYPDRPPMNFVSDGFEVEETPDTTRFHWNTAKLLG